MCEEKEMEAASSKNASKLHIVMFPWFAYGHINPFINLSKKLSSHETIQISFISIPGNLSRIQAALNLSPPHQVIPLPLPPTEGLSPNFDSSSDFTPHTAEILKVTLDRMQPQIKTLLSDHLKPHIIVFDFIQHWLPPLASELGIKAVSFSVFPPVSNSYLTVPSRMRDPDTPPTVEDLKKPPKGYPTSSSITSMKTFEARDFQYLFKRFHGGLSGFERVMEFMKTCDATIYRTCSEIEGPYINFLKSQLGRPLLLAGPCVPSPPSGEQLEEKWVKWLGKFPEKSVIFCNFGSEACLSDAQIKELTLGLELTNMPFLLVLKFECVDAQSKLEGSLPAGFRERVRDRGVVHTGWVQQQLIVAHSSVGCFVTHTGFSSVVEGIVNDCQLAFVPQHGDQFLNCKLLSGDLKLGVEVNRRDDDGYFGKEDILEAINTIMVDTDKEPGRSIRENHNKWRNFFLNKDIQDRYVATLVKELHHLAHVPE